MPLKLLLIAGARPNFMKVAPLIHAIQRWNQTSAAIPSSVLGPPSSGNASSVLCPLSSETSGPSSGNASSVLCPPSSETSAPPIAYRLIHTGQHYDERMSKIFFEDLGIPEPNVNLEVGSGSHAAQTAEIMRRFEPVLLSAFRDSSSVLCPPSSVLGPPSSALRASESLAINPQLSTLNSASLPDWVIVVGDVNSTLACTLVASKLGVKVAHVEAGLRSFDRTMPEEINRLVTDALADLLFTPSEDANENLRREGIPEHKIKLVGNVMIDALVQNLAKARQSTILHTLNLTPGRFIYVTLHRPNNVDCRETLSVIMAELERLAGQMPVVFPLHPRTRKMLTEFGIALGQESEISKPNYQPSTLNSQPTLRILAPLGYHDSLCLTEHARLVLTDSGGLQEESTYFHTPCLTLRPNTERPITIKIGSNRLTSLERLRADFEQSLNHEKKTGQVPPLWDGHTAQRIVQCLLEAQFAVP